jgi:hypothetical protein
LYRDPATAVQHLTPIVSGLSRWLERPDRKAKGDNGHAKDAAIS